MYRLGLGLGFPFRIGGNTYLGILVRNYKDQSGVGFQNRKQFRVEMRDLGL